MKAGWLGVAVALAACSGGTTPVASVTPSASPLVSVSQSPVPSATPVTSPTPSPRPSVNLSCRLPVTWSEFPDGTTQVQKAGFLTFPDNTLRADPSAAANSQFYDRGFSKWLPVWRQAVSPDGRQYAYTEGDLVHDTAGKVHVVTVSSGADRVVYSGKPIMRVVDFAADGIYMTADQYEGYPRGLWVLNPSGGAPRLISSTIIGPVVGNGAAWGIDFNAADPHPAPGGIEGPKNRVLRYDLKTGAATVVYYRPGTSLYVMGVNTDGSLFVYVNVAQDHIEMWRVNSTTVATRLFTGAGLIMPESLAAFDAHGVWFYGADYRSAGSPGHSLWLYSGGAIRLVTSVPYDPFSIAGGCIS